MEKKTDKKIAASKKIPCNNIIVLGVGNILLSDEGIGVHTINELQKRKNEFPSNVEFIEGGTDGFGLLNIISEADNIVVIDSLKGGGKPGSLYKFNVKEVNTCPDIFKTSIHQVGILEIINLSGLIGKAPEAVIIGVEPKSINSGMELSEEIAAKIPRIIELVSKEIEKINA